MSPSVRIKPASHACAVALILAPLAAARSTDPIPSPEATAPAPQVQGETPPASGSVEDRLAVLEAENAELNRKMDALTEEYEASILGQDLVPPIGDSYYGLGPSASKIYSKSSGLSIGGYGEILYANKAGNGDQWDALRAVLYFGYKFNDHWLFNSEVEFEHAGTSGGGSASVEFAYLDYMHTAPMNFRGGLVLIPMGFVNELHEPTTFLTATRPLTETRIMPSTWRENGVGLFGNAGGFDYRAYIVNGLDASGFTASGLRGGRQKGSRAKADDLAFVVRADYEALPGWRLGGSLYGGNSGQNGTGSGGALPSAMTTIYELHAEYRAHGIWARALGSMANVGDAAALNNSLGLSGSNGIGDELAGYYVTLGYEVLQHLSPGTEAQLSPYAQYEDVDTQHAVAAGFTADPANHDRILSFGLNWRPIDQVVMKFEYQDWKDIGDQFLFNLGYVF